ncbi:hypothetical protein [Pseudomonas sp. IT-P100]|uniref:hypothetical protein n=1 Tax=Pseudomonas sp. IT-P100 TaxID=3026452 RepID=UPI0039E1B97F
MVETLRRDRADRYLAERHMPMSQVAGLLDCSEQSVFNRASRRWFSMSLGARRRQLLGMKPDPCPSFNRLAVPLGHHYLSLGYKRSYLYPRMD